MPSEPDQIALTEEMNGEYSVGDQLTLNEGAESNQLAASTFTVTGFVRSSEFLDREQLGQTTLGTGQLDGFAAVSPDAFDSDVYSIARLTFSGNSEYDPYDQALFSRFDTQKEKIEDLGTNYTVEDRRDFSGYIAYGDSPDRIDAISEVFPILLFAIASLVSLTTMTRMVQEQRTTNGTFAALGYSPRTIRRKYVLYGTLASSIGAVLGVALGHTLLPIVIFRAYKGIFAFDDLTLGFYPVVSLIAIGIAILCTALVAAIVATNELKESPSRLLQPKPPAAGNRIFLERITPLWKRMGFTQKVTARNLFRYKKRMFMTIFGIAGCTGLLILAFGLRDSISGLVESQFEEIVHYDLVAVDGSSDKRDDDEALSGVDAATTVRFEQLSVRAGADDMDQEISYIAPVSGADLDGYVEPRDRGSGNPIALPSDGVILSEKLATLLDVGSGDTITVQDSDGNDLSMNVDAITEMYAGHYILTSDTGDAKIFGDQAIPNAQLIRLAPGASMDAVSAALMDQPGTVATVQTSSTVDTINSAIDGIDTVIWVLIVCAVLLAVVVIFNLTNINVSERIRELSTIKVLGFYPREVTMYIFRETLLLTILGILAGYALGVPLLGFVIQSIPPDNLMFKPDVLLTNYAMSAGITFAVSLIIMMVMHVRLKNIDMLDALKAQD
ncbi:ABC transporter permease [Ancrocorticia sp.]|uniref:ABC transporter permease n=1 Tax=Ancrocorticia sp. TaxID=2593684 RepID=UPI003F934847